MSPLLSIITVTKDDPAGLGRTVASAAHLREAGAEHIVIDGTFRADGLDAPNQATTLVRLYRRPPQGVADAFNAGIALATGTWLWFLNGGDIVHPDLDARHLIDVLSLARAHVVIGTLCYEGSGVPIRHPATGRRWPPLAPWIPHPATVVRRDLFARFGLFDTRYQIAMDYEWWLRVLRPDVAVEVLDTPFAVFAPGGMSQRAELRGRLMLERDDIIRRHQARLWREHPHAAWRLAKAGLRALLSRRLTEG